MNQISFILSLLETPIGKLKWDDRQFFSEIVEGYTSAYAMHKRHETEYKKETLKDPDSAETCIEVCA